MNATDNFACSLKTKLHNVQSFAKQFLIDATKPSSSSGSQSPQDDQSPRSSSTATSAGASRTSSATSSASPSTTTVSPTPSATPVSAESLQLPLPDTYIAGIVVFGSLEDKYIETVKDSLTLDVPAIFVDSTIGSTLLKQAIGEPPPPEIVVADPNASRAGVINARVPTEGGGQLRSTLDSESGEPAVKESTASPNTKDGTVPFSTGINIPKNIDVGISEDRTKPLKVDTDQQSTLPNVWPSSKPPPGPRVQRIVITFTRITPDAALSAVSDDDNLNDEWAAFKSTLTGVILGSLCALIILLILLYYVLKSAGYIDRFLLRYPKVAIFLTTTKNRWNRFWRRLFRIKNPEDGLTGWNNDDDDSEVEFDLSKTVVLSDTEKRSLSLCYRRANPNAKEDEIEEHLAAAQIMPVVIVCKKEPYTTPPPSLSLPLLTDVVVVPPCDESKVGLGTVKSETGTRFTDAETVVADEYDAMDGSKMMDQSYEDFIKQVADAKNKTDEEALLCWPEKDGSVGEKR